jgi:hypothetical protein
MQLHDLLYRIQEELGYTLLDVQKIKKDVDKARDLLLLLDHKNLY